MKDNIVNLEDYKMKQEEKIIRNYTILDLILDKNKRQKVYDFYDKNYKYIEEDDFSIKIKK